MNFLLNALGVLVWLIIIGIILFAVVVLLGFTIAIISSAKDQIAKDRRRKANHDE